MANSSLRAVGFTPAPVGLEDGRELGQSVAEFEMTWVKRRRDRSRITRYR
jgi:hypothetical protein